MSSSDKNLDRVIGSMIETSEAQSKLIGKLRELAQNGNQGVTVKEFLPPCRNH